jgi:hypothetical protein
MNISGKAPWMRDQPVAKTEKSGHTHDWNGIRTHDSSILVEAKAFRAAEHTATMVHLFHVHLRKFSESRLRTHSTICMQEKYN